MKNKTKTTKKKPSKLEPFKVHPRIMIGKRPIEPNIYTKKYPHQSLILIKTSTVHANPLVKAADVYEISTLQYFLMKYWRIDSCK